jgi:polyhydroxyalkanoate synthesis regulator phasin
MALLDEADARIVQKIAAADFSIILANLIRTGQVDINLDAGDLAIAIKNVVSDVIAQAVAAGEVGTNAATFGGREIGYFATNEAVQQLTTQIQTILQNGAGDLNNNTTFSTLKDQVNSLEGEVNTLQSIVGSGGGTGGGGWTSGGLPINTILDSGELNADGTPPIQVIEPQQDILYDCGEL